MWAPEQHVQPEPTSSYWKDHHDVYRDQQFNGQYSGQPVQGQTQSSEGQNGAPDYQDLTTIDASCLAEYWNPQDPRPTTVTPIPGVVDTQAPQYVELQPFLPPSNAVSARTFHGLPEFIAAMNPLPTFRGQNENNWVFIVQQAPPAPPAAPALPVRGRSCAPPAPPAAPALPAWGRSCAPPAPTTAPALPVRGRSCAPPAPPAAPALPVRGRSCAPPAPPTAPALPAWGRSCAPPAPPAAPAFPVKAPVSTKVKKPNEEKVEVGPYIKKPPNAFMLFLKEHRKSAEEELGVRTSALVNKLLGERWKAMPAEEKTRYATEARSYALLHHHQNPDWSHKINYAKKFRKRERNQLGR